MFLITFRVQIYSLQCSIRFYKIWPSLHLQLHPLFAPSVMVTLASLLFFNHLSLFQWLERLLPSCLTLSTSSFVQHITFSVSPCQSPYLIIQSSPSLEFNSLYSLFMVHFFSKAFSLLLCLPPAGMNLVYFVSFYISSTDTMPDR